MDDTNNKGNLPDSSMSLSDHLEELRWRLMYALIGLVICTVACLFFGTKIIAMVQIPYNRLMPDHPLVVLAPIDAFVGYMKVSLIAGLVLSSPWVFYQLWMFVATGMYTREKKYIHLAVPFSAVLFVAGTLFFLFVVAQISLGFFLKFGDLIGVTPAWTFPKYMSFMTMLMLVFGVGFQTPIAIFFLNRTGLISLATLQKSRRYIFLAAFLIAAIATPPDVISQITLAVPLYLLFELGILLCRFARRKK
ncbi:twin-arginine translocase subunit TatC [Planctomycetota bacterium]